VIVPEETSEERLGVASVTSKKQECRRRCLISAELSCLNHYVDLISDKGGQLR
jgi:hypothetical protein